LTAAIGAAVLKGRIQENQVARASFIAAAKDIQKSYWASGHVPEETLVTFGGELGRCIDLIDFPIKDLKRLADLGGTADTYPDALAAPMVADLMHHSHWINTDPALQTLAQEILAQAVRAGLSASQSIQLEVLTALLNRVLVNIREQGAESQAAAREEAKVVAARDTDLAAKVDRLLALAESKGDTQAATNANVQIEAIVGLAKRIAADVEDFDQAFAELERAVAIVIEVQADASRRSNAGELVDQVLTEMAALSAQGKYDEAAQTADHAFEQWQQGEAERQESAKQQGIAFLDAGIKQDIFRRDPVSAARRLSQKVGLEYPNQQMRFNALRAVWREYYERGRDAGVNFDLAVSIELANSNIVMALGTDQRGYALNDQGISLKTLGERDVDMLRLEESVTAFRAALQERTQVSVPLDWAETLNNLGNVLYAPLVNAMATQHG
jgi:hypothetical protein